MLPGDRGIDRLPLRVLVTPAWYPWPDRPLFGVFAREQAHAVARVADVAILTWRHDPTLKLSFRVEESEEDGLATFRVRSAAGFNLAGCHAALARLRRRGWRPDVIHAHEYIAGRAALSLGKVARAPVVVSEHYSGFALGTLSERERRRARWAFEHASVVCPVSRNLAGHVRAVAPGATLEPVPNVVDTDVFVPTTRSGPSTRPRLVNVGGLVEVKGHRHLIAALAQLRRAGTNLRLDVVGDGPLRPELEGLARDLGVDDLVTFHGGKPRTAVAAALREADVFVLPSLWENLPCAALEAMSTGIPIVATRVGGVPEVVDRDQGILVAPGSSDALADGLLEMIAGIGGYDREQLRAKAVLGFGYEAIARRWLHVYAMAAERSDGDARVRRRAA
jgi:glycosyltransferase involved in cell wall biosynthesis